MADHPEVGDFALYCAVTIFSMRVSTPSLMSPLKHFFGIGLLLFTQATQSRRINIGMNWWRRLGRDLAFAEWPRTP
jgi:hypothetical protein